MAATPSPFFFPAAFPPTQSHNRNGAPTFEEVCETAKTNSSVDNHQLQPASLLGMGQDIKPTSQLHELSCWGEARATAQVRTVCSGLSEVYYPKHIEVSRIQKLLSGSSSKSSITHMTWGLSQHLLSPPVSLHRQSGSTLYKDFPLMSVAVFCWKHCAPSHITLGDTRHFYGYEKERKMTRNNNCPSWQPSKCLKFSDNMIVINALHILINAEMHALFLLSFSKSSHHFQVLSKVAPLKGQKVDKNVSN